MGLNSRSPRVGITLTKYRFLMMSVNSWTEWGTLEDVCVGRADNSCFARMEANFQRPSINCREIEEYFRWPEGRKKKEVIDGANEQLDNLVATMEGEGINVRRPAAVDHYVETKSPSWSMATQYGTTCPRDIMITIGNVVLETNMSKRSRFFEYLPYRTIVRDLWKQDKNMLWKAMPKASLDDDCFNYKFWQQKPVKGVYEYVLTEKEPIMEAADIVRCGKDIFVLKSLSTNDAAIDWLTRELGDKVRIHSVHFPDDLYPFHIDTSLVPLRPGFALTNPEHPLDPVSAKLWTDNEWQLIDAPNPISDEMPVFCFCSKWLAMNMLSLSKRKVVVEETQIPLINLLEDYGFDVVPVPFRRVYEFGGALHCTTWDIRREDSCKDYFPNQ